MNTKPTEITEPDPWRLKTAIFSHRIEKKYLNIIK